MLLANVNLDEPILQAKINEWRVNKLQKIQRKFNLPLDAVFVFGGCDPKGRVTDANGDKKTEGLIPAGCVFVHFSGDSSPHTGPVAICRNPARLPSDIQLFEAVNVPEFAGIYKDIVLFSVKSKRPDTDVLSGGNLGGDKYLVCREKAIEYLWRRFGWR
eukprot:Phypoly_transcript_15820.p1 GENE.Phypoly_transcript_15820~~Phypoly_transcript_15820.p1  ORF type:complete len:159 (+),score=16.79 Phypoly_transcript_15820:244-720(+)